MQTPTASQSQLAAGKDRRSSAENVILTAQVGAEA